MHVLGKYSTVVSTSNFYTKKPLTSILQISMPGWVPAPWNASSTPSPIANDQRRYR